VVPLGKGEVKRHGKDITILTYSRMTYVALDAAERLAEEGIDSEIIDMKTLKPLDFDLIAESVKKTKHVLVAHEACLTGGFGAEVAARIGEEVFDYLDAPVTRIGAKDTPIPVSPILENFVLPQVDDIVSGAKRVLNL
jgi:pyruvate/2-oxoglutarate/acetoin dehydrogenase E1 component